MPKFDLIVSVDVKRTPRLMQLEGLFDLAPTKRSELRWQGELPLDDQPWQIGMIVGPSGCGKSTLARGIFPDDLLHGFEWHADKSVVDSFPAKMPIKEITTLLSQVGFSSPPAWLRPFRCLSNGEQFRVTLARAMAESRGMFVIDEFTSVVDRTVAQIGSAALAKSIRRGTGKMIAVGVHYDVIDWLQPDWVYEPHTNKFQWRSVQSRPSMELEIVACSRETWRVFQKYHYLDTHLKQSAKNYAAIYKGHPIAFFSVLHWPHPTVSRWRGHRVVCLPDYQGIGIGNVLCDFVAGMYLATGKPFTIVTSSPARISYLSRSKSWDMRSGPGLPSRIGQTSKVRLKKCLATNRLTASFDYVGSINREDAKRFGVI
jgi:hypothetical protein